MARKKQAPAGQTPGKQPPGEKQLPETAEKVGKGSQHRPRAMVALRPGVYDILTDYARKQRRAASWELHNILLEFFVSKGEITQEEADELWDDVIRRRDD
jgi:hypothetical protein